MEKLNLILFFCAGVFVLQTTYFLLYLRSILNEKLNLAKKIAIEDKIVEQVIENKIAKLSNMRMNVEKVAQNAGRVHENLSYSIEKAQKTLKLFDVDVPIEQVLKEVQTNKYSEAKKLLLQGRDASSVAKDLGMSVSEVVMVSSLI